jgi:N-acetylglutamate synthase-like GNAT family acetyltransferase
LLRTASPCGELIEKLTAKAREVELRMVFVLVKTFCAFFAFAVKLN